MPEDEAGQGTGTIGIDHGLPPRGGQDRDDQIGSPVRRRKQRLANHPLDALMLPRDRGVRRKAAANAVPNAGEHMGQVGDGDGHAVPPSLGAAPAAG